MYKDILAHLEQNSQRKDPKKELLNLLVKLSENKTISGVTDVVEEFITDASNNLVDRNRLFGQPGETAAQGLKKKVSNTVVKCLTDQINEQFDQINGLEKERELYLKKIRSMESQLQASLGPGGNNPAASAPAAVAAEAASVDILTGSTASAIEKLFNSPSASLGARVSGHNESILNSFVSQYIPLRGK